MKYVAFLRCFAGAVFVVLLQIFVGLGSTFWGDLHCDMNLAIVGWVHWACHTQN